jgi:hypothetical protein
MPGQAGSTRASVPLLASFDSLGETQTVEGETRDDPPRPSACDTERRDIREAALAFCQATECQVMNEATGRPCS